jgi:bifunctional non-homologous end joining protein LigD
VTPRGTGEVVVAGRALRLTRLDKVLWPAAGFTKRDLISYYLAVAPALLPHLAARAVTLARYPDGVEAPFWFQANCPPGRPDWLRVAPVAGARGQGLRYCRLEEPAALAWAANAGAIELHPFLADADTPWAPRVMMLDLDPGPPATILDCARVALRLRVLLAERSLDAVAKTSGSRGIHVVVPVDRSCGFAATQSLARALAARLEAEQPERVTARLPRRGRTGKVLVDWRQNAAGLSTVAPYSLRATPEPRASTPIAWTELERAVAGYRPAALAFGPGEVVARIARLGDLFRPALAGRQRLAPPEPIAPRAPPD